MCIYVDAGSITLIDIATQDDYFAITKDLLHYLFISVIRLHFSEEPSEPQRT